MLNDLAKKLKNPHHVQLLQTYALTFSASLLRGAGGWSNKLMLRSAERRNNASSVLSLYFSLGPFPGWFSFVCYRDRGAHSHWTL